MDCKLNISMDIEDVLGDQALLLYILKELVVFCNAEKIPCDLYISGVKLSMLISQDESFVNEMKTMPFIKVGYHGNTHSYVPVVLLNDDNQSSLFMDYIENSFFNVNEKKMEHGLGGLVLFKKYFDSRIYRCPGLCWSPLYLKFMKNNGFNVTTIDIDFIKSFECDEVFFVPVEDIPLESFDSVEDVSKAVEKKREVSLYLHPAKLLYDEFWDKSENRKKKDDFLYRLDKMKKMLFNLKEKYEIHNVEFFTKPKVDSVDLRRKFLMSMLSKWRWSQMPRNYFSERHLFDCMRMIDQGFLA